MTLTYTLDQNDYLQHQLFVASKTERIRKQRTKTWLTYTVTILLLSFMFYQSHNAFFSYFFLSFGIVFLIGYPFYERAYYKTHYEKYILETYQNRFGQTANVTIGGEAIEMVDITGETKVKLGEIENITETGGYFYLKLKAGGHIIIPKIKISNVGVLQEMLKHLCGRLGISFIQDLNWRWK